MLVPLIFKLFLCLGSIYLYWYAGTSMPESASYEMGPEQWPQWLLILLIIFCAYGVYQEIQKLRKANYHFDKQRSIQAFKDFFKSRIFKAILVLIVFAIMMEPFGFIVSVFVFMILMPLVFGERNLWKLLLIAFITAAVLYFGFGIMLQIRLPRGTISIFRNFALWLEKVF